MASAITTIDTVVQQQQKTTTGVASLAKDFDQFLTLLTTQLQNQDPLSPMDTNQFTQQLVSFAGVEQQINSNQKLDSLVQMQLSNAFSASLGYVGLDVSYLSNEIAYDGTTPATINYALESTARTVTVNILDESGSLVYSGPGKTVSGKNAFVWDGKSTGGAPLPEGTYTVRIDALDDTDGIVGSSTVVSGRVRGVETQQGIIHLLIGERAVPMANILNAAIPPEEKLTDAQGTTTIQ
ncbi:MAG: flagellar hook capping family protein [Rhodospirillales bacterium]|nr:flagellar hook capping family protein [Rhodospirillales bacterium]